MYILRRILPVILSAMTAVSVLSGGMTCVLGADSDLSESSLVGSDRMESDSVTEYPAIDSGSNILTEYPAVDSGSDIVTEYPAVDSESDIVTEYPAVDSGSDSVTEYPAADSESDIVTEHTVVDSVSDIITEYTVGDSGSDIETKEVEIKEKTDISKGTAKTKSQSYAYTGRNRCPNPVVIVEGKTLVKDKDYRLTYKNNKNVGTGTVIVTGTGDYKGTLTCTFKIVKDEPVITVPVYRVFNPVTGEHFYTKHLAERDACVRNGWNSEGIAWYSPETSSAPVYRVSNPNNGHEHHYTKSVKERDWLVSLGWNDEGIAFYSCTDGGSAVYRLYHPTQRTGNHHYTTSKGESDYIAKHEGWKQEGICWYVSRAGG